MAWFFAHLGPHSKPKGEDRPLFARNELLRFETNEFLIVAGGSTSTCLFMVDENQPDNGWLVAGSGIIRGSNGVRLMNKADWKERLSAEQIDITGVDGHFVILVWKDGKIRFQTDPLGVRNLLVAKTKGGYAFSSRYNWLSSLLPKIELDIPRIGSYYLSSHQLGGKSLIKGIDRLVCGAEGLASKDSFSYEQKYWENTKSSIPFNEALLSFGSIEANDLGDGSTRAAIGLSGGIDSRVVLAARSQRKDDWTFTYDEGDQADIDLAEKLASSVSMEHHVFESMENQASSLIDNLKHSLRVIGPRKPAFTHLHFQYYDTIESKTDMMLHGSYGEVLRQGLLANILFKGKKALKNRDWEKVASYINHYRPAIFKPEHMEEMKLGREEGIEWLSRAIPSSRMTPAEMLEWIVLRVCLPFTIGWSQNSDDEWFPSISPLIQPSVIASNRSSGMVARHNGRGVKAFIKERAPELTKFPLAKNNHKVPFGLGQLGTIAYIKMRKDKRHTAKADPLEQILLLCNDHVQDRLQSRSFLDSDYFDREKVENAIAINDRVKLRWWLTFDTWQEILNEENPFIEKEL